MYPNIEAERVRKGISREKLAEELNVSISTYYNWLAGRTAIPSTDLKKMANIFRSKYRLPFNGGSHSRRGGVDHGKE